jgi:hypothetical protein
MNIMNVMTVHTSVQCAGDEYNEHNDSMYEHSMRTSDNEHEKSNDSVQ